MATFGYCRHTGCPNKFWMEILLKENVKYAKLEFFRQKSRQIDGTLFCDFDRFFVEFQFKPCWDTLYLLYLPSTKKKNQCKSLHLFFFSFSIFFRLLKNTLSRVYYFNL